jgi:simple sugar transport system permease protein
MEIVYAIITAAVPLVLASLGGLLSERAGVLNISMEGCITAGAFSAALVISSGGTPLAAVAAAVVAGIIFGSVLAGTHLLLGANLFIAGLGINLLIPSLAGLLSQMIRGSRGTIRIPENALSVFQGPGLILTALSMPVLAILAGLLLDRSRFGRYIRAAGSGPDLLRERGISPEFIRYLVLLISSVAASLAGVFLAFRVEAYVPGMSSGRGWIALVIIWMGFRRPQGMLLSAYLFSMIEIISGRAQGLQGVPATLLLALPYITALVALTAATIGKSSKNLNSHSR